MFAEVGIATIRRRGHGVIAMHDEHDGEGPFSLRVPDQPVQRQARKIEAPVPLEIVPT